MKKKHLILLLSAMLVFGLMALGSGSTSSSSSSPKEIVSSETQSEEESSTTAEPSSENNSETTSEPSASKSSSDVTIEEQVLIDQDGLKVTALSYDVDSIWGDGIKLLVENNGSSDIGLGCTALIVNDYMITDLFSSTVAAGKKSTETLSLSSSGLKAAGIEKVGKIEIYFHTFDPDTYMTQTDFDCVTIQTSAYDSMDIEPDDAGKELYNSDGIRIVGKYVDESSFWGAAVLLYIENNSGANKIIQCDDMSINGFMVTPLFSSTVYDGKKAIDEITLLSSDLKDNGITSVDDIELKFKIISEDYMNSTESEPITFSAK